MDADRVLVTGATGGIGSAVCRQLAAAGATPVIGYHRRPKDAAHLARELGGIALEIDMTDHSSIDRACDSLAGDGGGLRGVVLAAALPPRPAPFGTISEGELDAQLTVSVKGPQRLIAGLVRQLFRPAKRGVVVGVLTSAMGDGVGSAAPNLGAYLTAKYAMAGLLAVAAADYPWLTVRTVSPGFTDTPMLEAFDARYLEQMRRTHPFTTPEHVAADILAAVHL